MLRRRMMTLDLSLKRLDGDHALAILRDSRQHVADRILRVGRPGAFESPGDALLIGLDALERQEAPELACDHQSGAGDTAGRGRARHPSKRGTVREGRRQPKVDVDAGPAHEGDAQAGEPEPHHAAAPARPGRLRELRPGGCGRHDAAGLRRLYDLGRQSLGMARGCRRRGFHREDARTRRVATPVVMSLTRSAAVRLIAHRNRSPMR